MGQDVKNKRSQIGSKKNRNLSDCARRKSQEESDKK